MFAYLHCWMVHLRTRSDHTSNMAIFGGPRGTACTPIPSIRSSYGRVRDPLMLWNNHKAQRALFAVTCACAPSVAWAQVAGGLLPAIGMGYGSGDLRSSVESVLPGAPTVNLGPRWQYTASLGIDLGLTQTNS